MRKLTMTTLHGDNNQYRIDTSVEIPDDEIIDGVMIFVKFEDRREPQQLFIPASAFQEFTRLMQRTQP